MWIELHDNLPDHPKIVKLSVLTKMDRDLARAKLERLWLWALVNRIDGVLTEDDVLLLTDIMRLKGSPEKMVEALVQCQLLDSSDGGYAIHDWDEHVGMLRDRREAQREQSRLRKQRQRDKQRDMVRDQSVTCHADVTRDQRDSHAVTVTYTNTYTNNDIMTDTISVYPAREEQELSTGIAQPKERVEGVWMGVMNTIPSEEELKTVRRHSVGMDISAVQYALELACLYGAANPAAYAARVLNEWNTLGIRTEAAAREWREGADGV